MPLRARHSLWAVTLMACGLALQAATTILPVENPGFEDPQMTDGQWATVATGWTISASSQSGVQNPQDPQFAGTTAPATGLPEGAQMLFMNMAGTVSQVLSNTLLTANTLYTLRVRVGDRRDLVVGAYEVQLRAGGQVLASGSTATLEGGWATVTLAYEALPGEAQLNQPLEIVLAKAATVTGEQVCFDAVRLEANDQPPRPSPTGLVAHWAFDEGSGTAAQDSSGLHPGQLSGSGVAFVSGGVAGGSLQFDRAQNGYVWISHLPELVTNDFSVVLWVKLPPGDTSSGDYVLTQHEAWAANGWLVLANDAPGWGAAGKAGVALNTGAETLVSANSINDGQWHQVALVYRAGGSSQLFLDGGPAEASLASSILTNRGAPLLVGGVFGVDAVRIPKGSFTGWVDELQAYRRAISQEEVDSLFQSPGQTLDQLLPGVRISPAGGGFTNAITVTLIAADPLATVRYTLDGSEPQTNSALYTGPITLLASATVKAKVFAEDLPASETFSAVFTRAPDVTFSPAAGYFTNAVLVTLQNNLGTGTAYYTVDGTDPTPAATAYALPIALTNAVTIKARVFVNGFPVSLVYEAAYARVYALDDGIPAEWRERYFGPGYLTDPRVGADADPDGDSWSNLVEYRAGSDPTQAASQPTVTAGIRAVPLVTWNSLPGFQYRVLRKTTPGQPVWEVILPAWTATDTQSRYVDTDAPATAIYQIELVR